MMPINAARDLLQDLREFLGAMPPEYVRFEGVVDIPRPPLFGTTPTWRDHDLHAAMKPRFLTTPQSADFHEVFAMLIDTYLIERDYVTHPFREVKVRLRIDKRDHPNLFPKRARTRQSMEADTLYALAMVLFCAYAAGHPLFYGKDWALVSTPEGLFGFDQGHTVSNYEACCIAVPAMNWQSFFEQPREGGSISSKALASFLTRAHKLRNARLHRKVVEAVLTLIWAGRCHEKELNTTFYYPDVKDDLLTYILGQLEGLDGAARLTQLRKVMVPALMTGVSFDHLTEPYGVALMFPDRRETEKIITHILETYGLTTNKNNKGKPYVDSTRRTGTFR